MLLTAAYLGAVLHFSPNAPPDKLTNDNNEPLIILFKTYMAKEQEKTLNGSPANLNIIAVTNECKREGLGKAQCAYVLATMEWETAHTFLPVREAFWMSETWRRNNLRYYPYYGRGFVQLTWRENYSKYNEILNLVGTDRDIVKFPDKVMTSELSTHIIVHGMKFGTFTTKRLSQYISSDDTKRDFVGARRIVNGTDKARDIAALAEKWYRGEHLKRFYK